MLATLPKLDARLADPKSDGAAAARVLQERARARSSRRMWIAVGICTHLGCSPTFRPEIAPADLGPDWLGGFFCPCHQSKFDLAGRVFKGVPAPTNLVIPPHKYAVRHARRDRRRHEARVTHRTTPGTPRMSKLLTWIDERFPLTALWESQWGKYVAPKNFNFWYYFGSLAALVLVMQIVTGIFLTMNYKPDAAEGVRVGRVHHARRAVGLADPLHALDRRVDVLRRRVPAHVPRADVRQLPQAARAHVDLRLPDLPRADGRGVLRLPAAVGPDVVLGRAGDRQPVLDDPGHRRGPRACGSAATTRSPTSR